MIKQVFIITTLLISVLGFGQQPQDSLKIDQIKKDKINRIVQWEKLIDSARERSDLNTEMIVMMDMIYFKINDYGDATSTFEELIYLEKLVEQNPNIPAVKHIEAPLNMFMGCLLRDQFKPEESLVYLKKASELAKKNNQKEFYKDASCHVAEVLGRLGKKDKAIQVFKRLENEAIKSKDSILRNRVYEVMAGFYMNERQVDSALIYSRRSIDDFSPTNQRASRLCRIAECYLVLEREMDSVVYYAEKALSIANNSQLEQEQRYAHNHLRQAYGIKGSYEKAFFHFEKYYELKQNQRSYNNAIQLGNLTIQKEKEQAGIQEALVTEKLSNQQRIIWLVSGGLLILVLGLLYILNRLKLIRKQNIIIEKEKLRAEQSERYKEQFLANMSHEIRTPMHAISGMVNALRRQQHPDSQTKYLEAMKTSADNLLVILNDVLDMSKIEYGNLEIEEVNMSPIEIIIHVIHIFQNKAEEKGLSLDTNIEADFPNNIIGDPGRFNQVLMNLVSNAIKFTESGHIDIELIKKKDTFIVAVKDTGYGISVAQSKTIFESFQQGNKATKEKHGGTGLGLAIAKKLIELQQGKIWIESELDKGSSFYFELPLIVNEAPEEVQLAFSEEQLKTLGAELNGLNILIAEDNDFNIMVVQDDLQWYIPKVQLTIVPNGEQAVEKFKKNSFDLILMDVQMPKLNGYEATKLIRQFESNNSSIPIIAMTASLLKSQINKCHEAGMDGHIPKPYKPKQLIHEIYKFTRLNVTKSTV